MASLHDIADEVGLSLATVSAVMSEKADRFRIGEVTHAKVRSI